MAVACATPRPRPDAQGAVETFALHGIVLTHHVAAGGREGLLKPGEHLRSGDGLRVLIEVEREAYVYLVYRDAAGAQQLLFPGSGLGQDNRLDAGKLLSIPAEGQWLELDRRTGTETLIVLASREPIEEPVSACLDLAPGELLQDEATRGAVRRKSRTDPERRKAGTRRDERKRWRRRKLKQPMRIAGVVRGEATSTPRRLSLEIEGRPEIVALCWTYQHDD
ncbi:MAG: DUF4384 domain-containing protein [Deltaproteobacteria bacterium]|nr:DUF4384 domain-containing protein [Deltaproteobacteria bacterium]